MPPRTTDVKGKPVELDTLVQGFYGHTKRVASARVVAISPWGWIVGYDPEKGSQHVFSEGRYLVRGEPRPFGKRGDVPERLVHG